MGGKGPLRSGCDPVLAPQTPGAHAEPEELAPGRGSPGLGCETDHGPARPHCLYGNVHAWVLMFHITLRSLAPGRTHTKRGPWVALQF